MAHDLTDTIEAALALDETWQMFSIDARAAIRERFHRSELKAADLRDLALMLEHAGTQLKGAADDGQALYQVRIKGMTTADCVEDRHDACGQRGSTDPTKPCACPCHGQWGADARDDVLGIELPNAWKARIEWSRNPRARGSDDTGRGRLAGFDVEVVAHSGSGGHSAWATWSVAGPRGKRSGEVRLAQGKREAIRRAIEQVRDSVGGILAQQPPGED